MATISQTNNYYVFNKKFSYIRGFLRSEIDKVSIISAGVLVLLTYMMILFAFRLSKVSYVVAAREVSIVFSSAFGIFWLKEAHAPQRVVGAALIASGVVCIGLSR